MGVWAAWGLAIARSVAVAAPDPGPGAAPNVAPQVAPTAPPDAAPAAAPTAPPPYEPPPFDRFPDEPADLPPLRRDRGTPFPWHAVLHGVVHALDGTRVRVVAGVDAPLELAGGVELVLPWRIRVGTAVGVLPQTVERSVNTALVDHGVYDHSIGDLVNVGMQRVLLWRLYVAIQPWPGHGLLAAAGVGAAWLHGAATAVQVASALEMPLPDGTPGGDTRFDLASRLHVVDAELGWEWRLPRHWSLQLRVGVAAATSASTRVTLTPAITDPRIAPLADRARTTLDHAYTTYVKTPLLSCVVGFEL